MTQAIEISEIAKVEVAENECLLVCVPEETDIKEIARAREVLGELFNGQVVVYAGNIDFKKVVLKGAIIRTPVGPMPLEFVAGEIVDNG